MPTWLKVVLKIITVLPGIVDCIKYNIKRVRDTTPEGNEKEVSEK